MNAAEHRLVAALALGTAAASFCVEDKEMLPHAAAGCVGGYCFGTLPDLLEPAVNPHHRQFFHSVVVAGALGYGMYRLYRWKAETEPERVLRVLGLLAGGAYLVHLAMDATTRRSLPMLGRIA